MLIDHSHSFLRNLPRKTLYDLSITLGDTIDFAHTLYMGKDTKTLHLNQTKLFQLCINKTNGHAHTP